MIQLKAGPAFSCSYAALHKKVAGLTQKCLPWLKLPRTRSRMVPAREPVTIKLYRHRRLYRPATGRYVTRDELTAFAHQGAEIAVHDAGTGTDVTSLVLSPSTTEH